MLGFGIEKFFGGRNREKKGKDLILDEPVPLPLQKKPLGEHFLGMLRDQMTWIRTDQYAGQIAEKYGLEFICKQEELLPVMMDEVCPMSGYEFLKFMTMTQGTLWTTRTKEFRTQFAGRECILLPSVTSLEQLRAHLKKAIPLDDPRYNYKDKRQGNLAGWNEALKELREMAREHMNGQDNVFDQINAKWVELETKMKSVGATRSAALSRRIDAKREIHSMLAFIDQQDREAILDKTDEVNTKYKTLYSDTERAIRQIRQAENQAILPQLPPSAIGTNYSFDDWVEDENEKPMPLVLPPMPKMTDVSGIQQEELSKAKEATKQFEDQITDMKKQEEQKRKDIQDYQKDNDAIKAEGGKKHRENIVRMKRDLYALSGKRRAAQDIAKTMKSTEEAMGVNYGKAQQERSKLQAAVGKVTEQLDQAQKVLNTMLQEQLMLKAKWKTNGTPKGSGAFENFSEAAIVTQAEQTSETNATSTKAGATASGGFMFISVSTTKTHEERDAKQNTNLKQKKHRVFFSMDVFKGEFDNDLWTAVDQLLMDEGWYLPGKDKYWLWNQEGADARFIVKKVIIVQKYALYVEDEDICLQLQGDLHESTDTTDVDISLGFGGGSVGFGFSNSSSNFSGKNSTQMKLDKEKKTIHQGNMCLRFILLDTIRKGPMNKDPEMDSIRNRASRLAAAAIGMK